MEKVGTEPLLTERLYLRRFTLEDAGSVFENWAGNPDVCRFLSWSPHESAEETRRVLADWMTVYDRGGHLWAITERGRDQVIGDVIVHSVSEPDRRCELGYALGEQYWGMGYATEAARAVIAFLFDRVNMNRITVTHDVENAASGRVAEKAGMNCEGLLRQWSRRKDGSFGDHKIWSVLRGD